MIDKLGLSTVNWKHGSDKFAEGTEEYYQNLLIRDYIALLIDPKSQHILHRSIDKDTKLLKDVLAEIESGTSVQEEPYGFYSLSTQTERKDDYITGKIGIGPFALNNNNHILTMLYGVKFREFEDSIMTKLGLTDLSGHLDKDGNSIMSWLSALINAHVDIAKDPYISRLNVGPFTYNLVNTLIRTGLGAKTFYFTTLPVIKELSKAYDQAGSSYMADLYKSKYQLQKEAIEQVGKDRFGELKIGEWTYDQLIKGVTDPNDKVIKPIINEYIKQIFDDDTLRRNANKNYLTAVGTEITFSSTQKQNIEGEVVEIEGVMLSPEQVQLLMYLAYLLFDPYATSVSNLVKYSKIDTKKHGKSYIEQLVFLKGFDKLFNNPDGSGLFEPGGLDRLAKQSYIELKTINAISMTENILKGLFLQSTNAFKNAIQVVLNMIGKGDSLSVDLWNEVSHTIMASIKSEYINLYARALRPNNSTYIHDLVSESEENLEYTQVGKTNRIKLIGEPKYDIRTYMHKPVHVSFDYKDTHYERTYNIIGYDEDTNELIVDKVQTVDNNGKIRIEGGENTIYDRFNRLAVELRDDPSYRDILDVAGEPTNMLLRSLVTGKTFEYKPMPFVANYKVPEGADTYETLKFVKLFNALDQNGVESNQIIDAWDALLHDDKHPKLKEFAEDLVVYAFVTSGDQGGFTKFFKQVPFSWRKESGYADFIARKLVEYQSSDIDNEQLEDAILNNWFNGMLIPKYDLADRETKKPNFIAYTGETKKSGYIAVREYPTILAALRDENGVLEPSIDPDKAPLFIKIPRRNDKAAKDSQRRVTVYRRMTYGMRRSSDGNWVHYPIYIKIEPKGNLLRGNFLMTEYGREDSTHKEFGPSEDGLRKMFVLGDFIARNNVEAYKLNYSNLFGQLIEDMNYLNLFETKYDRSEKKFIDALNKKESLKVNIPVIIDTVDKEGFHEDEKVAIITSLSKRENGYQAHIVLGVKEYNVNLDNDFNIINKTRFSEIYNYNDKGERILLKDIIPNDILFDKSLNDEYEVVEETLNKQYESIEKPTSVLKTNLPGVDTIIEIWAGSNPQNADLSNIYRRPFKLQLFEGESPIQFHSVEQAFQYTKFRLLSQFLGFEDTKPFLLSDQKLTGEDYKDNLKGSQHWVARGTKAELLKKGISNAGVILRAGDENYEEFKKFIDNHIQKILNSKDGWEAKRLGGPKGGFNIVGNSGATFLDTIWRYGESVAEDVMKAAMKASFELNTTALNRLLNTGNATLTHTRGGEWSESMPRLLMEVREELRKTDNSTELVSEGLTPEEIEKLKKEAEEIKKQCKGE